MSGMVYQWRSASRINLDPQVVGEHLESLRKTKGSLTPAVVVRDAKRRSSPIHDAFDWNDAAAAVKWREQQARVLVGALVVRTSEDDEEEPATVRAFVHVGRGDERQYTSIHAAMSDPDLRAEVVADCKRELESIRRKYKDLREFSRVWEALAEAS